MGSEPYEYFISPSEEKKQESVVSVCLDSTTPMLLAYILHSEGSRCCIAQLNKASESFCIFAVESERKYQGTTFLTLHKRHGVIIIYHCRPNKTTKQHISL